MAKYVSIIQLAIFNDTVENTQIKISEMYLELGLKPEDITYRQFDRYVDEEGEGCVFAVIEYKRKVPAQE